MPNYIVICPVVSHKKIFNVFFFSFCLPRQPEFCMDSKSLNNFQSVSPLKLAQWFRRKCHLKKLWTDGQTNGRRRTVCAHNSSFRFFGTGSLKAWSMLRTH